MPRQFEFGAVCGGMRVVFDYDISEIYISSHYAYPARLVASGGEAGWLLNKRRGQGNYSHSGRATNTTNRVTTNTFICCRCF